MQTETDPDTVDHQARKNRLNISDHTSVLGVDILAHPQAEYALMHDVRNQGGLDAEPELSVFVNAISLFSVERATSTFHT